MTTKYIDPAFHGTTLPTTYVVPGNLALLGATVATTAIGNCSQEDHRLAGYFTSDGSTVVIPVGFAATEVDVINWTDGLQWKWMLGAPATDSIKITDASPAIATDTGTAITVTADAAGGLGDVGSVTLSATLCGTSKVISFRIVA